MRRAQATRAELEVSLAEIDTILASPGYSSRIRDAKRREGMMIRERLLEGDLQVGDQIALVVQGEPQFTDTLTVGPGRVISLPGVPDIALRGILRSEAQEHLTVELRKYVRDPSVRVQALIRMSVRGAVGNPGFYQVPAELLVSDAIMLAGGPSGMADPNKTEVRRAGSVLLTESEIQEAIIRGSTLDQLNLRAGDELIVDTKQVAQSRGGGISVFTVLSAATTVVFMLTRILR
jgi:polysaccharide export outer membrane protein